MRDTPPTAINAKKRWGSPGGPQDFKKNLKDIEYTLGRKKNDHAFGPRTIDLDILVWNGQITNKDFFERKFVQEAVLEIFPDLKF